MRANPNISRELDRIINKLLEKNRELRYQTAAELRADLKRLKRDTESTRVTAGSATPAMPHRSFAFIAGAVLIVVIALFVSDWLARTPLPPKITGSTQITADGLNKGAFFSDGNRIYFDELTGDHNVVSQVSTRGGETAAVTTSLLNPVVLDVAPNTSELLVADSQFGQADYPLWIVPVPAGFPRRIDTVGHDGTWLPNGKLLFTRGSDLFLADHAGSNSEKLLTVHGVPWHIRVSPDLTRIRFTVVDATTDNSSLWEAKLDGSDSHPLLPDWNNPPQECCGEWTHDGSYFFFQSVRDGVTNIWALADRRSFWRKVQTGPLQLTTGPLNFGRPLPSRDGRKLFVLGWQARAELVRYDVKSGGFLPMLPGSAAAQVDFSRDGKWVAYVTYGDRTLWKSRPDGSERLQLTYPPLQATLPHWSPDGSRIAFTGAKPGQTARIFAVAAAGGTPEQLSSGENEADPTWSKDGGTVAFGHVGGGNRESAKIMLLDLQSRALNDLPGSRGLCCPRWSPDGRYIVALTSDNQKLLLFDFSRKTWQIITEKMGTVGYITWAPDSTYIGFDTLLTQNPGFYRMRVGSWQIQWVASLRTVHRFSDVFGPWSGMAPDGSPLVARDISTQEIYALDFNAP